MDNITTITSALRTTRQNHKTNKPRHHGRGSHYLRQKRRPEAFSRWVSSLNPTYYVFYRVNGVHDLRASTKVQAKLHLMPCLKIAHRDEPLSLFQNPFILYVWVDRVQPYNQYWTSVDVTASQFPMQTLTALVPSAYYDDLESKILPKVPFPEKIRDRNDRTNASFKVSTLRFYRFHMFFHQDKVYEKNYGIIDRMWDSRNRELQLSTPPNSGFGAPDIPKDTPSITQNHFLNPEKNITSKNIPQNIDLQSFLKTYRSNVPLYKH